jgi:hypothetical protein
VLVRRLDLDNARSVNLTKAEHVQQSLSSMEYHVPSLRDPRLAGKPAPVSSADPPTKAAQADGTTVAAACHGGEALLAPRHTAESAQRTLPALHADGQPANVPESGMPLTSDAAPDRGSQGAKSAQPPILGGTGTQRRSPMCE